MNYAGNLGTREKFFPRSSKHKSMNEKVENYKIQLAILTYFVAKFGKSSAISSVKSISLFWIENFPESLMKLNLVTNQNVICFRFWDMIKMRKYFTLFLLFSCIFFSRCVKWPLCCYLSLLTTTNTLWCLWYNQSTFAWRTCCLIWINPNY